MSDYDTPLPAFNHAGIVTSRDRIFPARNQARAWENGRPVPFSGKVIFKAQGMIASSRIINKESSVVTLK